jgi:hypothetical protein
MESTGGNPEIIQKKTPWLDLWFSPAKVTHRIFATLGENRIHRLMMLRGILALAAVRAPFWVQNKPDPLEVILLLCLIGPIIGLFFCYALSGALGAMVRKASGLNVPNSYVRIGIAWSFLPSILGTLGFFICCFALYPEVLPMPKPPYDYFSVQTGLIFMGLGMLWSLWIRVVMTSEIAGLSRVSSLWVNLLALLATDIPIAAVVYIYSVMMTQILDFA